MMSKQIVKMHNKEPRSSTWILKDGFGFKNDHRYLVRMVQKYKSDFEELGVVTTERQKPKSKNGGRPVDTFLLNEGQCMFLGTLFRNTPKAREFKVKLVKEFTRMKAALSDISSNQKNSEWLEKRKRGKVSRLEETDAIKTYVDYAKTQGSKNAGKYYMVISKKENKALFFLEQKFPNLRDALKGHQLETIANADRIVARQLKQCVDEGRPYKEGYQMAKTAIESFAKLIGKSLVPSLELIEK